MSSTGNYIDAVIPETFTVLGLQLKPMAIGHWFYLQRFDLFPVDSKARLISAVVICSTEADRVIDALNDRWLDLKLRLWSIRLGEVDWQAKILLFNLYVASHYKAPSVISKRDGGGMADTGTPFLYHVKVSLQAKLGLSPSEAWCYPIGAALMDYYAMHELEGDVSVSDREHRANMKKTANENAAQRIIEAQKMRARN